MLDIFEIAKEIILYHATSRHIENGFLKFIIRQVAL